MDSSLSHKIKIIHTIQSYAERIDTTDAFSKTKLTCVM